MQENGSQSVESDGTNGKRLRAMQNSGAVQSMQRDGNNNEPPTAGNRDGGLTPIHQMISMIGALLAQGDRASASVELLVANIAPDMLADIVITNMAHLPATMPPMQIGDGDARESGSMVGVLPLGAGVPTPPPAAVPPPTVVPPPIGAPSMGPPLAGVVAMVIPPIVVPAVVIPPTDASTPSQTSADARRDPRRVSTDLRTLYLF